MPFNRLSHSVLGEIRPRFRLHTSLSKEEVFERIKQHLKNDKTVSGSVVRQYALLKMPPEAAHYWSPELQVRLDFDEYAPVSDDTIIRCLIGPKQTVWSLFVFFYAIIGVISFFGGMYGVSQLIIGQSSWFIWLIPLGLILIPSIWLIAKAGQSKGRDEMLHLVSFLYHSLEPYGELKRIN